MKFVDSSVIAIATAGLSVLAVAFPAFAQDAAPAPQPQAAAPAVVDAAGIEDIVVTARRREEGLQNVPIAITALTGSQLEQKGLRSTEDLRNFSPGLNIGGQRRDEAQFFIRGQGPGVITTGQRNFTSVATYFAEVPTSIAGPGVFFDMASVQVLKGPQGTLFGRNTTGGAVLFEPARPTQENGGYVKGTYGNYDYFEVEGMVNAAIVPDKLALRIAGQVSRRDGFTKSAITGQKLDGRDYEALRASLLYTPVDGFENLTIIDYRNKDNSGSSSILRAINPGLALGAPIAGVPLRVGGVVSVACLQAALPGCPAGGALGAIVAASNGGDTTDPANSGFYLVAPTSAMEAILAQQQALGVRKSLAPLVTRNKSLDYGITNRTIFELNDNITLKNIIAFRVSRKDESIDYDGTPLNFLANANSIGQEWGTGAEQFTEEFQIQGKLPSANLEYILGFYHEHTKPGFLQQVVGTTLGSDSLRLSDNKDVSDALFAHFEWNPLEFVGLSGGVRRTWDKREASLSLLDATGACSQTDPATGAITCPLAYDAKFSAWTYDVTLNVKPTRGVLGYASYRRGFKSGGINLPAPIAPPPLDPEAYQTFAPETVDSFEVGLKADWAVGIPVRTNLALFYDKYKNIQVQQPVTILRPDGSQSASSVVRNGVRAKNKGFEFDTTVVPFRALSLSGFVSYLSAHSTNTIPGVIIAGRQFKDQPKWKYGVSGNLKLPVPEEYGDVHVLADWSWRSKVNSTPVPDALVPVNPSYGVLNARIEWTNVLEKGFDLSAYATNLTNKTYVLGGYPIYTLGFDSVFYGEPRMYGVSVKVRFGSN